MLRMLVTLILVYFHSKRLQIVRQNNLHKAWLVPFGIFHLALNPVVTICVSGPNLDVLLQVGHIFILIN